MSERDWDLLVTKIKRHVADATAEWRKEKGFVTSWDNLGEKLMLVMTEVSEAMDESLTIVECMDEGMLVGRARLSKFEKFEAADLKMQKAHRSAVEEWTDVMVRCMDIIGSLFEDPHVYSWCGVFDDVSRFGVMLLDDNWSPELLPWRDAAGPGMSACALAVLRQCSLAMEAYRDIDLGKPIDHGNDRKAEEVFQAMVACVEICVTAIRMLGIEWMDAYAEKMRKNEARPVRHNRQR